MEKLNVNKPKFPEWAPKQGIAEWEKKTQEIEYWHKRFPAVEPETEEADVLVRLLTYHDMRGVWERLPKYKIKPDLFISLVQYSLIYRDFKPYNLTPAEHAKWLDDVKKTALKLRSLVEFSDYDRIYQEQYLQKRGKLVLESIVGHSLQVLRPDIDPEEHKKSDPPYKSWPDLTPELLSEVLYQIGTMESDNDVKLLGTKSKDSVKLDKPKHANAKRSYFIRQLTQELRETTGSPLRNIVTITAATVFDTPSLTERQIIRIAPTP